MSAYSTRVRIPQITDIRTAIELYYTRLELDNADIKKLFGVTSNTTVGKLKTLVREIMAEKNILFRDPRCVNTIVAYEAWGLNIKDLEERYTNLQKLNRGCRVSKSRASQRGTSVVKEALDKAQNNVLDCSE